MTFPIFQACFLFSFLLLFLFFFFLFFFFFFFFFFFLLFLCFFSFYFHFVFPFFSFFHFLFFLFPPLQLGRFISDKMQTMEHSDSATNSPTLRQGSSLRARFMCQYSSQPSPTSSPETLLNLSISKTEKCLLGRNTASPRILNGS